MRIGSWLSRYVERNLVARFVQIELLVGVFGGLSAAALFFVFVWFSAPFKLVASLSRRVADRHPRWPGDPADHAYHEARSLAQGSRLAGVLTFDYLGALAVSILFPLVLVPHIGLVRSALLFGLLNVLVALWALWLFREQLHGATWLRAQAASFVALAVGFGFAGQFTTFAEAQLYTDEIVYTETTRTSASSSRAGRTICASSSTTPALVARRVSLSRSARASGPATLPGALRVLALVAATASPCAKS